MGSVKRFCAPLLICLPLAYGQSLPPAVVHQPYHHQLDAVGSVGCTGYQPVFQLVGGQLATGLRLHTDGRITGESEQAEAGSFLVRISTPCSNALQEWSWTVRGEPMLFVEPAELSLDSQTMSATALVSASWEGLAYSITTASGEPVPAWLSVRPRRGRTPPKGSPLTADQLAISVEPSLAPPGATAELLIHTWRGNGPAVLTVKFGFPPAKDN